MRKESVHAAVKNVLKAYCSRTDNKEGTHISYWRLDEDIDVQTLIEDVTEGVMEAAEEEENHS